MERIPNSQLPSPEDLQYSDQDYLIGPSDILRISVMDLFIEGQEATLEKLVSQSGYVDLPLLEQRVKAGGLTQEQVAEAIKKAYQPDILRDATVSVAVIQPRQNIFSILGAVNRPGTYGIARSEFTLLEALALAGDVSQPNIEWIYVFRNQSRQPKPQEKKSAADELPALPKIPTGTPSQPAPAQPGPGRPAATSTPGQEGPNLQEQLKDLERLIPGASATPRKAPYDKSRVTQPIYMSGVGGDVASSVSAGSAASAGSESATGETSGVTHPAWRYARGRWVSVQPGATQSAPATEEGGPSAAVPAQGEDPYGWKKYTYSDQVRVIAIDLHELKAGEARLNIIIHNQDIVQVPVLDTGYFYVMGEVARPGVYDLRGQRITVKEAVAAAGNLGPLSWPANTVLYRRVGHDQEQMMPVDLNAIFAGREPDIFLKPDDVIAVGSNWIAPFMATWRSAFRMNYGFGFTYDRNYSDREFEVPIFWPRPWYRPTFPSGNGGFTGNLPGL
jgi:protein involved in polysaccharide export with SLBB domain